MKRVIGFAWLLANLIPFGSSAQVNYPPSAAPPVGSAYDCVSNATQFGLLSQEEALKLCLGSSGVSPYDCYEAATRQLIDSDTALKLCRCAISTTRVDCYVRAKASTTLADSQILELCTHDAAALNPACNPEKPE